MGTSLQEKIASLPPERQARIKTETVYLQATYVAMMVSKSCVVTV